MMDRAIELDCDTLPTTLRSLAVITGLSVDELKRRLRSFPWDEFEAARTPDATFAKALDRLQPILLNHAVGGGTWTDYNVDEARERRLTERIADEAPTLWAAAKQVFADAVANGWLLPAPVSS